MPDFELVEPESLEEALRLLDHGDPDIRPMGGGTALMLMMKARFLRPRRLVSLRRIPSLTGITVDDLAGEVRIGGMTRFADLEHAPEIARWLPVVKHAMRDIANVRIRNVATVGGNLAHADPHLDLPPIWAALGAEVILASPGKSRVLPVEEISLGYYETALADGELITGIRLPLPAGWRSSYVKVTTRAAHDWPALGLAIAARFEGSVIAECRLVLSAATDRPIRLRAAEGEMVGVEVTGSTLARAAEAAVNEAEIESDGRGSRDYKNQLLSVYLRRSVGALAAKTGAEV